MQISNRVLGVMWLVTLALALHAFYTGPNWLRWMNAFSILTAIVATHIIITERDEENK